MSIWVYVAILIVSTIVQAALAPKPQSRRPEAIEEIDFPQAEEGTPQPVIFGDCWTGDWMVLAVGNYSTEEIRGAGGKK